MSLMDEYRRSTASGSGHIKLNCKSSGCGVWKVLHLIDLSDCGSLKNQSNTRVWYCHLHREAAFQTSSVLSFNLVDEMARIATEGEVGSSTLYINKSEFDFLRAQGLVTVGDQSNGSRLKHPVALTEEGRLFLNNTARSYERRDRTDDAAMKNDFGFTAEIQGVSGATVELYVTDVEGEFLGVSMSEHQGLNMRRVAGEMHDLDQVIALRNCLDAYIQRAKATATATN